MSKEKAHSKGKSVFGFPEQADKLINYFRTAGANDEAWFQIFDMFPIPIEIFAPDGISVFANRALLSFNNIENPDFLIGKYNLLKDPVCNETLGMREGIEKAFRGEVYVFPNFPVPINEVVERGITKEKPFEKATMDYLLYPIWKEEKLHFVVCVFLVRNLYIGRSDVVKAKEYIDINWQGEYKAKAVAQSVNMSVSQLYHLFKQHIGMTPGEYHKKCKVERIKEKLGDKSLSIKEAFALCGEDSQGYYKKVFKEITGLSPEQFRKELSSWQHE